MLRCLNHRRNQTNTSEQPSAGNENQINGQSVVHLITETRFKSQSAFANDGHEISRAQLLVAGDGCHAALVQKGAGR